MLFNSFEYIFIFLPVVVGIFYFLRNSRLQSLMIWWLVAASLFYYGWWNVDFLWIICASIVINYLVATLILSRDLGSRLRWLITAIGIGINLAALGYFKYALFLLEITTWAADTTAVDGWTSQLLPLGISFFTFQQIAFLVDTQKGLTKEYNFVRYCLFVTFFPQLISGPIVHHAEMMPQFHTNPGRNRIGSDVALGLTFIAAGLFKKVVLADRLALWATPVFNVADAGFQPNAYQAWVGGLAYTFQIYFDFSGYTDIAIGSARLFGIRLPQNFASPYKAESIIDFWRRWHITLSRFLRDYLYFPLGGSRRGMPRRYVNLLITMILGGLWHGAGWTFVFWGLLHGLFLIANHLWRHMSLGFLPKLPAFCRHRLVASTVARTMTFLAVLIAWIFFRAETFSGALSILAGMIGLGTGDPAPLADGQVTGGITGSLKEPLILAGLLLFVWFSPSLRQIMVNYRPVIETRPEPKLPNGLAFLRWRPNLVWALICGGIYVVVFYRMMTFGYAEFIYRFF